MKVVIEFDGNEEQQELLQALHAADAFGVLWNLDQRAKSILDHCEPAKELELFCREIRETICQVPGVH